MINDLVCTAVAKFCPEKSLQIFHATHKEAKAFFEIAFLFFIPFLYTYSFFLAINDEDAQIMKKIQ